MKNAFLKLMVLSTVALATGLHADETFEYYFACDGSSIPLGQDSTFCKLPVQGEIVRVKKVYNFPPNWDVALEPNDCNPKDEVAGTRGQYSYDKNGLYVWGGCNGGFVVEAKSAIRVVKRVVGCPNPADPLAEQHYEQWGQYPCSMGIKPTERVVPNSIKVAMTANYSPRNCNYIPTPTTWRVDTNNRRITVFNGCHASFTVTYKVQTALPTVQDER